MRTEFIGCVYAILKVAAIEGYGMFKEFIVNMTMPPPVLSSMNQVWDGSFKPGKMGGIQIIA
jgi:hypothetical protein